MNSLSPLRQFSLVLSLLLASTWSPVFAAEADRWNPVYKRTPSATDFSDRAIDRSDDVRWRSYLGC